MEINKNLISRNHTAKKRTKSDIEYIVIHYVGALGDAKANTEYYKTTDAGASADFFVGHSGDIWQANDYYNYYSWHCGGGMQSSSGGTFFNKCFNSNSIGIEMCVKKTSTKTMNATDKDWYFTDTTVESAAQLTAYLMKELDININHVIRHYDRNGKFCPAPFINNNGKVTWDGFKKMISSYYNGEETNSSLEKEETTTSYYRIRTSWADSKSQFGAYTSLDNAKQNCPIGYSVYDESGIAVYTPIADISTLTASQLTSLSESDRIKTVAPIYQQCQKDTGMLASVGLAQFCLESGYATTDLAQNANNMHGMKCSLSGNTWANSTWNGSSKYTKKTAEQDKSGNEYYVTADFRKYPCIKDSVYDRAAYFIGAKNGNNLRYPNINTITNAQTQVELIKSGGYATDTKYVSKLMNIISKWNLTQYDVTSVVTSETTDNSSTSANTSTTASSSTELYRVGTGWNNSCVNQHGAFNSLENAKKDAESAMTSNKCTYYVFNSSGESVYEVKYTVVASYVVQAGSFSKKTNATVLATKIKAKKIDAIVVQNGVQYVVQCGIFSVKSNADNIVTKLKSYGFDAIIKIS